MELLQLLQFPELNLYARRFENGAKVAAKEHGINIVIDVFRASNTILELLKCGAEVIPVATVEDAMNPRFDDFVRVGEDDGEKLEHFDFDNSPVFVHDNSSLFSGKKVVIRTTNGTRGIVASKGSTKTIVGTFQNFSAVVKFCYIQLQGGNPISFISMGSHEEARIEDDYCAIMFVIKILEELGRYDLIDQINDEKINPWLENWKAQIIEAREVPEKMNDYKFSLQLDTTLIIPVYNPSTGFLDVLEY